MLLPFRSWRIRVALEYSVVIVVVVSCSDCVLLLEELYY